MKPTLLGGIMLAVALAVPGQTTKPAPTTTLTSSSPTLQLPGSLALTATVAPATATAGMPTGTVQFLNGTNSLGTGNLAVIPSTENFSAPAVSDPFGISPFGMFALPSATAPYSVLGILDWYQIPNAAAVVYEPQVTIFSGQGASLFQTPTPTQIPNSGFTYIGSVDTYAIGDFNHDGLPDVLLHGFGGNGNQYYLLPGTAGGGFNPTNGVTSPDAASLASCFQCSFTIAADDFNEDGYPDVAYASIGSTTIGVALNAGAGTPGSFPSTGFNSAPPLTDAAGDTYSAAAVASGHFTSSGHADLVVAGYFYSPTTGVAVLPGNVALFTGNGDGTFGTPTVFTSGSTGTTPTAVATADLRANGMTDVVLANAVPPETGGIRQATARVRTYAAADPPSYTVEVFFGDGQAGLTISSTVTLSVAPASLTIVDFNKDGYPDILVTGTDGSLNLILNDGTGHFSTVTPIGTTSGVPSLTTSGDFNGDGLADIAEITDYAVSDSDTTSTVLALLNSASSQATLNTPPQTLPAGTDTLTGSFPSDNNFAASTSAGVPITVTQTTPTIAWAAPATIQYGTALSATQLNATANFPGSFTYSPAAGTVLHAGRTTITAVFAPTDSFDYSGATATQTITVTQVVPTITWPTPATIQYGTALSATQLNATASVPGTFTYSQAFGTVLRAGQTAVTAVFTPTDNVDYSGATATQTITVTQAVPTISWAAPATMQYGTALSAMQLNATASVPGTFTYSQAAGTVLPVGQTTVTAVFAPTDSVDYSGATATQTITVIASPATATATAPETTSTGQTESASLTVNSYPVPMIATLTLSFAPTAPNTVSDPAVLFPNNTTTEVIQIPANTTADQSIDFSTGSTAGTITLTVVLTAGGTNVTPNTLIPLDISVPASPPVINSVTLARNAKTMTVTILGLSSTRDMTQAHFHFTPAAGQSLNTTDLTVDLTSPFGTWYGSSTSDTYGTTFLYTQPFTLDSDASAVGSVAVTLTNSKGDSQQSTAQ